MYRFSQRLTNRRKLAAALTAGLFASVSLSACGQTDAGGDKASAGEVPAEVSAAVQQATKRPTDIGVKAYAKDIPTGKTVAFIQCSVPSCVVLGGHLKRATDALGWKLKVINAGDGSDPLKVKNAWSQAVTLAPDAVIGTGFPRNIMESQIQALKKANIPVIMGASTDAASNGITASLNSTDAFARYGAAAAQYVVAQRGVSEKTSTVYLHTPGFPIQTAAKDAFQAEYKKICGPCKFHVLDVPGSSIGTDLPQRTTGFLLNNPGVNAIVPGFSDLALGLPNALRGAGLQDRIKTMVTIDVNPTVSSYIKEGLIDATVHEGWEMWMWRAIDVVLRHQGGDDTAAASDVSTFPTWTVTKKTLPSADKDYPMVEDFADQFKAAWGTD